MPNQLMPSCLIPLEGAYNFRDMGGYRTTDGRTVKQGLLFRAAELTGLTADDHRQLEAINLKHVFDYRNRGEAEQKPDPAIGQAVNTRVPANEAAEQAPHIDIVELFQKGLHHHFSQDMLLQMYTKLPIGSRSYRELMKLLSSPETNLPLVQHCAGGRDRTGVGSMLILLTLGVPYESVMEDYLLSNITLTSYHQELYDMVSPYISLEELRTFEETMRLQEKYLDASMDSILREYGSFERYLELEFGIDEAVRTRIQDYCLE